MKRGVHLLVLASLMLPAVAQKPQTKPAGTDALPLKSELQLGQRIDGTAVVVGLDGKPCALQDLLGKVTVINFHSTKSKSQRNADAHLATLQRNFEKHDVSFLHINSNANEIGLRAPKPAQKDQSDAPKPYARIRDYLGKHELPFRVYADHHNRLANALGALSTPHVFAFSADGTLVYRGLAKDDEHKYLRDVITKLVASKLVKPFEHLPYGDSISRVEARQPATKHTTVTDDATLAHKAALREGKLLIYNFTGFNCASCRVMEEAVFREAATVKLMSEHVVEARLHTDSQKNLTDAQFANNRKLQAELARVRVTPMFVAIDQTTGEKLGTFQLSGGYDSWGKNWRSFVTAVATKAGRIPK